MTGECEYLYVLLGKSSASSSGLREPKSVAQALWYNDLSKLSNDELMRMYTMIKDGRYEFAKNAWYIPIGGDQRCPIMVAKGYRSPDTLTKMAEFQDTAKVLEGEYRNFIDAWDFGYISTKDIENAVLKILEERNIEIAEQIPK